jgi:putative ABC transport system permease protein
MIWDYFRLAYRSARQRKMRSWLTMIGIFIGIAAVVSLISLSQGLQSAIQEQFIKLGSDKLVVQAAGGGFGPPGTGIEEPLAENLKDVIEKVKGVDIAVGRLIRIVQIEFKDELKFTYAVTMPGKGEDQDLIIEANDYVLAEGKFFENDAGFEVVIGADFAEDFFDRPLELRDKVQIQGEEFKIVGVLKKSGNPQQDSSFILPEKTLRSILGLEKVFDVIPLKVSAGEDINQVSESVSKALRKERNVEEGKEDFTISSPQDIIATLNNILLVIQGVLVGIAAISLLVGGIGIMNTMYTAVLERTREIGIMKAVGAKNKEISLLFMIESGFLGFFGGLIGVVLGISIGKFVELVAFQIFESALIKASFPIPVLIGALLFSFFVGSISGVLPARQAAKLKPVEALRG